MNTALVIAVMPFVLAAFVQPRGLLVSRETRRRWRHHSDRARQRSSRISKRLRARVLRADRRRCVFCGSRQFLQVDHIVPWSLGGLTWFWNLATLCRSCNAVKGSYWVSPQGKTYYKPYGRGDVTRAAQIRAAEQAARYRPLRMLRAWL